ncbi:dynein regulatory complex protein 1 [Ambystoma mexicanum]|uniref:dynein regulatory complex protein 1 n=1 Tax=Ambystoma mexicanum TaxID=8296 RepID=UPI0037E94382
MSGEVPEEEVHTGPSTESEDQQERLIARRLRIAEREEAKRREAAGEDPDAWKEVKEDPRRSHKQVEDSRQILDRLVRDGTQLVTNVQVAVDGREAQRRAVEEELKRQRFEKLSSEAQASLDAFEDITNKWIVAKSKEIPQDIWEVLIAQQQDCVQLIEEKNKLITELQEGLRVKDDQYVIDLKNQADDTDLLIERMEEQIRNLTKTYCDELLQIEKAFELERRELMAANKIKWEKGMQTRRDQELEYLLSRMKKMEEYEQQLKQVYAEDAEDYSIIKIRLETDVQILEQQLQQMKAVYQLNQEKLDYNFQVLKKRDEENGYTKSQQKRKITRIQDVLNKLTSKLEKQKIRYSEGNERLTVDYKRLIEQYTLLQKKIRHFASVDSQKYNGIWLMNEEEMKELVKKVLEADRIINEQQLGLPWSPPDLWFMENIGPLSQKQKKKSATQLAAEVILVEESQTCDEDAEVEEDSGVGPHHLSSKTVKQILGLVSDESGFLVEGRLLTLLEPLEKNDHSLIKLDAIFAAMGVDSEDDLYELVDFFIKYRTEHVQSDEGEELLKETIEEVNECKFVESSSNDLIHPNDVLRALRDFVKDYRMPSEKPSYSTEAQVEVPDCSADAEFWKTTTEVIPEHRLTEWDTLETALFKYHGVLVARSQLLKETAFLRQQNSELQLLLHQYLNSKINSELEVPPSQVLQIDYCET